MTMKTWTYRFKRQMSMRETLLVPLYNNSKDSFQNRKLCRLLNQIRMLAHSLSTNCWIKQKIMKRPVSLSSSKVKSLNPFIRNSLKSYHYRNSISTMTRLSSLNSKRRKSRVGLTKPSSRPKETIMIKFLSPSVLTLKVQLRMKALHLLVNTSLR